jgi:hypothetical protein
MSMEYDGLPIDWPVDYDAPSFHADQFAVSRTGEVVYIIFGEVPPPIVTELNKEKKLEALRERGYVPIKPRVSVVVSSHGYQALTNLLVKSFKRDELEKIAQYVQELLQENRSE